MKLISRISLLVAPLTLALALGLAPTTAKAQAAASKVAIVNPARVFNELQETKDLKQAMEGKRKTLEAQEFEKRNKLKDMQTSRDQLKPDSPQYADKNKELQQAAVEFEVWGRIMQADVQHEQKMQMKGLFDKITAAVQEVATAKGLDLVIAEQRPDFPDNIDQLNVDQLRALINSRNVMFNAAQADISTDVIAAMDAKYKSGR